MSTLSGPFSLKNNKGFSLVELMIVVAIIGVLAALAVPKFQSFQAKAKQSEAKSNLSHIFTLEQSYYGDQDKYSGVLTEIGFATQGRVRYDYAVPTVTASTFSATATAKSPTVISADCGQLDIWQIDQNKSIVIKYDCVTGRSNVQM